MPFLSSSGNDGRALFSVNIILAANKVEYLLDVNFLSPRNRPQRQFSTALCNMTSVNECLISQSSNQ